MDNRWVLVRKARVFAPEDQGIRDVLMGAGKILALSEPDALSSGSFDVSVVEAEGRWLVPGFVDALTHITGGGGEAGFGSRTPPMRLADAILAGVTTVVGALGTDRHGQSLGVLHAECMRLRSLGLGAFMYTGSYHLPPVTLTGDVQRDLVLVEPVIGVGEVAIADHRGSQPDVSGLARLASDAWVGGMLSGKSGRVLVHVGPHAEGLDLLFRVAAQTAVPLHRFYPTHVNRNKGLFEQARQFAQQGGTVDMTASTNESLLQSGEISCPAGLQFWMEAGLPVHALTFSTDGHASLPVFDAQGQVVGVEMGRMDSLHRALKGCVQAGIPLETALQPITVNPARILGLKGKGSLAPGQDADAVLLEPDTLNIAGVWIAGRTAVWEAEQYIQETFG